MRKFTSGKELVKRDDGRNDGRGFVKRGEHGGRDEPAAGFVRKREKRIIEPDGIVRKIIFITIRTERSVYDGESGTAEVFHFFIKECVVRQENTIDTIMTADGSEFIPGEDADTPAGVEVLEGHRKKSPH